jgi:LysM repeat protein
MKQLGHLILGLLTAAGSFVTVVAALLLSLAEGPTLTAAITQVPSLTAPGGLMTPLPGATQPPTRAASPTLTAPQQANCPVPEGWVPYVVEAGDQLDTLAARAGITSERLFAANCLFSATLLPNTILYLPHARPTNTLVVALPTVAGTNTATPTRSATRTPEPCGPPRGWVRYTVQPQDNLYRLSQAFGVSVAQLQSANCLAGTLIRAGTRLYVPNVPTNTPEVEDTEEPQPTDTPDTPTPETPSPSPTETGLPPSPTDTDTPEPETPTAAPLPSDTPAGSTAPETPVPTETLKIIDNP